MRFCLRAAVFQAPDIFIIQRHFLKAKHLYHDSGTEGIGCNDYIRMSGKHFFHQTANLSRDTGCAADAVKLTAVLHHIFCTTDSFCQIAGNDSLPVVNENQIQFSLFLCLTATKPDKIHVSMVFVNDMLLFLGLLISVTTGNIGHIPQVFCYFDQLPDTSVIPKIIIGYQ